MIKKLLNFINQQTLLGEIMRFIIVGGFATVIDFLATGITIYFFDPELYPHFFEVFLSDKSGISSVVGTGVGFLFGLLANYLLSIMFVFNEKGKSKTIGGAIKFTIFSTIGFFIHVLGMYIFNTLLKFEWLIVKVVFTIIVLVYNYITRKVFIFKNDDNPPKNSAQGEN